jgi:mono/diheme cytochrome c family protein
MKRVAALSLGLLALAACAKQYETRPVDPALTVEITPERVARGAYLVGTVGACGVCHNSRAPAEELPAQEQYTHLLGGGRVENPVFSVVAPNITSSVEHGIGGWSDDELMRAIRDGVRPDGEELLSMMPYMSYQHLSDEDTRAIVAFLRITAPSDFDDAQQQNDIPAPIAMVMKSQGHAPARSVPEPDRADPVAYGEYLVAVGHCGECHSAALSPRDREHEKWLAGSAMRFEEVTGKYPAPNLTPDDETGLGRYTEDQIVAAIRGGRLLSGEPMQPPMSWLADQYRNATDEDLHAIAAYLKSRPPVRTKEPKRELSEAGRKYAAEREIFLAQREPVGPASPPAEVVAP